MTGTGLLERPKTFGGGSSPPAPPEPERIYWRRMTYQCDGHEYERVYYLEVGCEGPRDVPIKLQNNDWWVTADGRYIVPVPFVAGRCPGSNHSMTHVRWHEDEDLAPRVPESRVPKGSGLFRYPKDGGRNPQACGVPQVKT